MTNQIIVDAIAFEKLVAAAVAGDGAACRAAIDDMALAAKVDDRALHLIQRARKRERGIGDTERPIGETLPVPGHLPGSFMGKPILERGGMKPKAA